MTFSIMQKNEFDAVFDIMTASFPPEEYRKKEKQFALLDDKSYEIAVLKDGKRITAFIAAWKCDGFVFIEHLAVSCELRGKGLGSQLVKQYAETSSLPLVLEVEDDTSDISLKRIEFYKRLGFVLTDIGYPQPNLTPSERVIPLRIMFRDPEGRFDPSYVKEVLFKDIYKI